MSPDVAMLAGLPLTSVHMDERDAVAPIEESVRILTSFGNMRMNLHLRMEQRSDERHDHNICCVYIQDRRVAPNPIRHDGTLSLMSGSTRLGTLGCARVTTAFPFALYR